MANSPFMARMARVVIPDVPHHVTQRGDGRARTFFSDADYGLYRDLLAEHCAVAGLAVWAWVLMPNHEPLIVTPTHEDGLRRALGRVGQPGDIADVVAFLCSEQARCITGRVIPVDVGIAP